VGRARTAVCNLCGTSWDARARFCGRCGHALAAHSPAPPEGAATGDRRWLIVAGALVGVVALLAGVVALLDDLPLPRTGGDPAVSLPDAEEVGEGQGLDRQEREAALAPFDPDRTVCAPAGCELWRRPLREMLAPGHWVTGSPVVLEDEQLIGLDIETGAPRWQLPVGDELRAREGGPVELAAGLTVLAGNDELVVLANTHGVQLVTQSGVTRWTRSLPADGEHLLWAHPTQTAVLVVHEAPPQLAEVDELESGDELPLEVTITALDARDGELRWSHVATRVFPLPRLVDQEEVVLVGAADGVIMALALADGEPRYELPASPDVWPDHAGGFLTLSDLGRGTQDTSLLFDASVGAGLAELEGSVRSLQEIDGRAIVLLGLDGEGPGGVWREAVAIDPDGSIAWRHPVEQGAPDLCCPSILDLGGGWVRISDGPRTTALVVDTRDGSLRQHDPLESLGVSNVGVQWQLGPRLLMQHPEREDTPGYVLRDNSGRSLQISGSGGWPAPSRGASDEVILIGSSRELVAVRFP
jgi:outer membrane protein assembly factor BamB